MRVPTGRLCCSAVAAIALACARNPGDSESGFDIASEFARVTSARAELSAARDTMERARTAPPNPGAALGAPAGLRETQAAFDASYERSQKVLARFLTLALNDAPSRPETKLALDFYASDAVSNADYVLKHNGSSAAALKDLASARRAYVALGVGVPGQVESAIENLSRVPPPTARPSAPQIGGAGASAGALRRKGHHRPSG